MSGVLLGIPTPAAQVREELARLRRKGLSFDLAWRRTLERVKWPEEKGARDEWKMVLASGRHVWEDAYLRNGNQPKGMKAITDLFLPESSERQPLEVLA